MTKKLAKPKKIRTPAGEGPARGLWYLAAWRASRGWTQEQVAEKLHTTKGTVSKLETGERDLSEAWIKKYAKAFEITPADLMRHPGTPAPKPRHPAEAPIAASSIPVELVRIGLEVLARKCGMSDNSVSEVVSKFQGEMQALGLPAPDHRIAELRGAFDYIARTHGQKSDA